MSHYVKDTMNHYISLVDRTGKYFHVEVRDVIYTYIKQLEGCINSSDKSKLKELYKGRFE